MSTILTVCINYAVLGIAQIHYFAGKMVDPQKKPGANIFRVTVDLSNILCGMEFLMGVSKTLKLLIVHTLLCIFFSWARHLIACFTLNQYPLVQC